MDQTKRQTSRNTSIRLSVILTVLCLLSVALIFLVNDRYELVKEERDVLLRSNLSLKEEVASLSEEEKQAKEELEHLRNIKEEAAKAKEEFFANAKILEDKVLSGEKDVRIAYLTFDDGPYLSTSHLFLDVLEEYDVLATFFYLDKGEEYLDLYRRVIESGHTLANHTASHRLGKGGIYSSAEIFLADIRENRDFIYDNFSYTTTLMRFPGGSPTAGALKDDIVEGLRQMEPAYGYVDWTIMCGDGNFQASPEVYRDNILNETKDYRALVILLHDYSRNTALALPEMIEGLKQQGFIFLPLFYESSLVKK